MIATATVQSAEFAIVELQPHLKKAGAAHSTDLALVREIAERNTPTDQDVTDIGRLFMRYIGSVDTEEIKHSIDGVLTAGMERNDVMQRCRKLWQSGWRPGQSTDEITVGSGADAE